MIHDVAPFSLLTQVMRSLYGTRSLALQAEARQLLNQFVDDPLVQELTDLHELARLRIWTALRHPRIPPEASSLRPRVRECLTAIYEDDPNVLVNVEDLVGLLFAEPIHVQYALIGLENDLEIEVYNISREIHGVSWNFAAMRISPAMVELKNRRKANL